MLGSMLDILFPRRCVGCGTAGWPFCPTCLQSVARFFPPWCERCGRPTDRPVPRCRDCAPPPVSWSRSAFLYNGPVRRGLMRVKFGSARSIVAAFVEPMAGALAASPGDVPFRRRAGPSPDGAVISWVPLARSRLRVRGFDQAEALARPLAGAADVPARRLLERTRETPPQARRSGRERASALLGAFRAVVSVPPVVVLVDDVLTTGATAAECARVLVAAGAREVGLVTAARSLGGPIPARCYTARPGPRPGSVVAREAVSR